MRYNRFGAYTSSGPKGYIDIGSMRHQTRIYGGKDLSILYCTHEEHDEFDRTKWHKIVEEDDDGDRYSYICKEHHHSSSCYHDVNPYGDNVSKGRGWSDPDAASYNMSTWTGNTMPELENGNLYLEGNGILIGSEARASTGQYDDFYFKFGCINNVAYGYWGRTMHYKDEGWLFSQESAIYTDSWKGSGKNYVCQLSGGIASQGWHQGVNAETVTSRLGGLSAQRNLFYILNNAQNTSAYGHSTAVYFYPFGEKWNIIDSWDGTWPRWGNNLAYSDWYYKTDMTLRTFTSR